MAVENEQLKTLNEELLQQLPEGQINPVDSSTGHQTVTELQELVKIQKNDLDQWKFRCQDIEAIGTPGVSYLKKEWIH